MCVYVCVCVCAQITVESGFPLKRPDYLVLKARGFCTHSGHGAHWDTSPTVAPYEIDIAVAQVYVSTDPREEVSQQTCCICLSENETLTSFHQLKKGMDS